MLRVVLDTNVLVSAIISDGKPRELLKVGISKKQFSIELFEGGSKFCSGCFGLLF